MTNLNELELRLERMLKESDEMLKQSKKLTSNMPKNNGLRTETRR